MGSMKIATVGLTAASRYNPPIVNGSTIRHTASSRSSARVAWVLSIRPMR